MSHDDDDELRAAVQDAWPADEPPAGFADRVMAARAAAPAQQAVPVPPVRARPRRRLALGVLVAAGLVAMGGLFVATRPAGPAAATRFVGRSDSDERRSLDIGGRATAVAEPGASVKWKVAADGRAHVQQTQGNVFYRVERGGAFVVETPAGEVTVLGTCFRVEVDPMGPKTKTMMAAGAGAVVTAAVLVTVYEGKVRVSNAHGQVDVKPGETANVSAGGAPERTPGPEAKIVMREPPPAGLMAPPPADASREQLLARDEQHRDQIAMLDARLRKLETELGDGPGAAHEKRRAGPGGEKMFGLSQDEWAAMAEQCEIRFDLPPYDSSDEPKLTAKQAEEAGLSAEETEQVNALLQSESTRFLTQLKALYIEATGDTQGAETLNSMAMGMEIQHKSNEHDNSAARRRIALERAGKVAPPTDMGTTPVIYRYFVLVTTGGDLLQAGLTKIVGPERAFEMRDKGFGQRSIMSGCDDEDEDKTK